MGKTTLYIYFEVVDYKIKYYSLNSSAFSPKDSGNTCVCGLPPEMEGDCGDDKQ